MTQSEVPGCVNLVHGREFRAGHFRLSHSVSGQLPDKPPEGAKSGSFTRGGQASSLRAAGTGSGSRYVSKQRLEAMLDSEWTLRGAKGS
jgi:hypothetical protein